MEQQESKTIWKASYVDYKYIDGLDREVETTFKITLGDVYTLKWTKEKVTYYKVISKKIATDIINNNVSPFKFMKKGKVKHENKPIWKKGNYELIDANGLIRLRKYEVVSDVFIDSESASLIIDEVVSPAYYMEKLRG